MESNYEEVAPSVALADRVECFWIGIEAGLEHNKRVLPDGCADIVYARCGSASKLFVVGPMTRFREFPQDRDSCSVGVRFRPGMWSDVLRVNAPELKNGAFPLEDLWGKSASELKRVLDDADGHYAFARILAASLPNNRKHRSPLQKAVGALEAARGCLSLDTAAREAGFSTRQFRRRCLEATGFSPKLLARILRFRHASELVVPMYGQHAELAIECGYSDQSHFIADFHEFAGRTPCEMGAGRAHTTGVPAAPGHCAAARNLQSAIAARSPSHCRGL